MDRYTIKTVTVDPDDDAYTAADVVGGLQTLNCAISGNSANGEGVIERLFISDDDGEAAALNIYLFDSVPATIADDATFALAAADQKKLISVIAVAADDYTTLNNLEYAEKAALNIPFKADGANNLYFYIEAVATPTYAENKVLTFRFTIRIPGRP